MTWANAQLPTPSAIEWEDGTAFYTSSKWQQGGTFAVRVPDEQVDPRRFALVYQQKPAAVLNALRSHLEQFFGTSFDYTPPGESVALRVVYAEATRIQWTNPTTGEARVFLEEALAH